MKVREVCGVLNEIASPVLAAEWDNVGLLIGDPKARADKLLLCIDLTEDVLAEAIRLKAKMVMAYHPVIFKGIKRLTTDSASVAYAATRAGLAVYSMHTALDAAVGGTNDVLADVLGLSDRRPLVSVFAGGRCKITVFLPADELSTVANAAFNAGAGIIGDYHDCSFFCQGIGTFFGGEGTAPAAGQAGQHEAVEEVRLEMVAPRSKVVAVCQAIRQVHSYEEPVIDVYPLEDVPVAAEVGMGRVGRLAKPAKLPVVINRIKKALGVKKILLAGEAGDRQIGTAAVAAGAAGSIWRDAAAAGASLYLTGEMRHHDALAAAAAGLSVVCVGHSHSERLTLEHLAKRLAKELPKVKTILSKEDRDPFEVV